MKNLMVGLELKFSKLGTSYKSIFTKQLGRNHANCKIPLYFKSKFKMFDQNNLKMISFYHRERVPCNLSTGNFDHVWSWSIQKAIHGTLTNATCPYTPVLNNNYLQPTWTDSFRFQNSTYGSKPPNPLKPNPLLQAMRQTLRCSKRPLHDPARLLCQP